jgi:hypothetical protein
MKMDPKQLKALFDAVFVDICFEAIILENGNHPIYHAHAERKENSLLTNLSL